MREDANRCWYNNLTSCETDGQKRSVQQDDRRKEDVEDKKERAGYCEGPLIDS